MDHQEELIKCKNDFFYFAENYVQIHNTHQRDGLIPFNLYPYQKRLIEDMQNNRFVCGVKFRQGGFTTVQAIFGLWECMFHPDQRVMVIATSDRAAINISHIVKHAIDELPDWLKPKLNRNNDYAKEFSTTGSSMVFLKYEAVIGRSITRLIIDEAAFIPRMHDKWRCLYPCISRGGKCSVISTTNGVDDWFHDIVMNVYLNGFSLYECNHREHPEYWQRTALGEIDYAQELLSEITKIDWAQEGF